MELSIALQCYSRKEDPGLMRQLIRRRSALAWTIGCLILAGLAAGCTLATPSTPVVAQPGDAGQDADQGSDVAPFPLVRGHADPPQLVFQTTATPTALTTATATATATATPHAVPRMPILTYHHINVPEAGGYSVTSAKFAPKYTGSPTTVTKQAYRSCY